MPKTLKFSEEILKIIIIHIFQFITVPVLQFSPPHFLNLPVSFWTRHLETDPRLHPLRHLGWLQSTGESLRVNVIPVAQWILKQDLRWNQRVLSEIIVKCKFHREAKQNTSPPPRKWESTNLRKCSQI